MWPNPKELSKPMESGPELHIKVRSFAYNNFIRE